MRLMKLMKPMKPMKPMQLMQREQMGSAVELHPSWKWVLMGRLN
jgi:hypothetical protein